MVRLPSAFRVSAYASLVAVSCVCSRMSFPRCSDSSECSCSFFRLLFDVGRVPFLHERHYRYARFCAFNFDPDAFSSCSASSGFVLFADSPFLPTIKKDVWLEGKFLDCIWFRFAFLLPVPTLVFAPLCPLGRKHPLVCYVVVFCLWGYFEGRCVRCVSGS